ncbi:MAG: ATP synthase F1 subunit epsilon [Candidatus Magasanikbacteria bacterium RIFCSPHIGHO2_02_FULL_47_14]|uniref:ATP synthase epsilon chain n=1 Tax=Candidatus Magasanikbacteria bacterium RIFCSPHIGHO2_02_FULL_47_14 TaxID=1798680 RepID=A0A1F6LYX8_9BACT|nr:MAG: ATP synthase F1 subunit epsilon [Candidatus Magasanikbacteria bacterium RIFCSPHIGHO2_02_FULL_47_14]
MQFHIVTPYGVIYQDAIQQVTLPTTTGYITVCEHHAPLVSVLAPGEVTIYKDGYTVGLAVSGGMIEVRTSGEVFMMADTAERAEHIDIERAEEKHKRAEELLAQVHNIEDVEFARMQAALEKELARIRVGKKYKNLPLQ